MAIENLEMTSTSQHERELTITIAKKMVGEEFTHALNNVQRVATRPGFRPGKMPKNMVLNFYGSEIKKNLQQKLIEKSLSDACKKKELIPVSEPKIEPVSEIAYDQAFTYRAIFQIKPKVVISQFQGLPVEIKKFVFDETDVDDEIRALQENLATFVPPSDRHTIDKNDLVSCDSVVKIEGVIAPNYSHKDYAVPLFVDDIPADLSTALLGKKVGDVVSINYAMPDEHQDESIEGKNCEMVLTIKSFKERRLPIINDDFAKDFSDTWQSIDELKDSIRLRFNITAKRRDEYFRQDAITKVLIEHNPVDVPPALVERMALSLINSELEAMGSKVADNLVKNHWQELWQSVQDRALFRVKAELLFETLIEAQNIPATDEEIKKRVEHVKDISHEDAKYSVQVEKLLNILEKISVVSVVNEPLFKKS